jgi:hypothetical protein
MDLHVSDYLVAPLSHSLSTNSETPQDTEKSNLLHSY